MPIFSLFFLFYITATHSLTTVFNLNTQFASYALHGVNLDKWKSIQVNGCVDCDFLVDFSFRVCNEVPNGQEGHYTDSNIVICKDPYPFTINGKPPLNPHCEWRALIVFPVDLNNTWNNLYSCSYRLNGEKSLIVRAVSQKVSQNGFAFSFRVRQWVNESIPMFVLPVSDNQYLGNEYFLVEKSTMVTLVANPILAPSPRVNTALILEMHGRLDEDYQDAIPLYEADLTCNWPFTYSVFAGSDPGLRWRESLDFSLDQATIYSTSTVVTLLGNDYCTFTALIMPEYLEALLNYLPTYLTSYSYPWPFDNPTDYPRCQQARADFSPLISKTERRIAIDVIKLENGTLKLFYGTNPSNEKGYCTNPKIESKSIDLVDQQKVAVSAECFHLEFCPLQNGTKDRFGFVVKASRAPVDPKLVECKLTHMLSTENPQVLLNVRNIYFQEVTGTKPICVERKCGNASSCPIIIDLSFACYIEDENHCINSSPYTINGERPEIKDWEIRYTSRRVYFLLQARLVKESRVYLSSDADFSSPLYGGYSFRLPNTTLDETNFFFFPVNDFLHMREFGFRFAESPRGTWFSMVLVFEDSLQLRKFRGDHGNRSCEYQIVHGPPSNFLGHPELLLNTYRDTDVFQEQSLTSLSYSIYIPPGCAPSVALRTYPSSNDLTLRNCGGTVFFAALDDIPLNQIEAAYFCDSFPVNISFQTNSIGFGQISVQYRKNFGDDWIDSDVNTTLSNVRAVQLQCTIVSKWEKYKRCFAKIHFVRSFDNGFDDRSPVTQDPSNQAESCANPISFFTFTLSLDIFFFLNTSR